MRCCTSWWSWARCSGTVLFGDAEIGRNFYRDRLEPTLSGIVALIDRGLPHWQHIEFDTRRTTLAVFGMCWFIALDSSMRGETLDVDAASKQLIMLIFSGLQGDRATPRRNSDTP